MIQNRLICVASAAYKSTFEHRALATSRNMSLWVLHPHTIALGGTPERRDKRMMLLILQAPMAGEGLENPRHEQ